MLVLHVRVRPESTELREWVQGQVPLKSSLGQITPRLKAIVDEAQETLILADKANAMEFRGFEPGTEYSYRSSGLTSLTHVLSARTIYRCLSNDGDGAVDSALASLNVRRVERDTRWLSLMNPSDHQVPILLSLCSPGPEPLRRLQAALEKAEAEFDPAKEAMEERVRAIEMVWRRYYGSAPDAPRAYTLPMRSLAETLYRPLFTHRMVTTLRTSAQLLDAARKPWPGKAKATAAVAEAYLARTTSSSRWVPNALMQPLNLLPVRGVDADRLIADRGARLAVAVERFRRDHSGVLPRSLADLVPTYLVSVPEDPLSGRSMLFRSDHASYTIYSVGADGKDDGGDLSSELRTVIERGWGRRLLRGRDTGVRVLVH